MIKTLQIAADLLREAFARKWVLGLFGAISLVLVLLSLFLKLEVVDGALASSKLFGALLFDDVKSADIALRPVFLSTSYLGFYLGALFLLLACSDFAPGLLAPGRIEHLLSLPVSRSQLLFGTYLGVMALVGAGTGYGALGVAILFGVKTGVWNPGLIQAAALGLAGFCAIYAAMLLGAFVVRSAAFSSGCGFVVLVGGIVSTLRKEIAGSIDSDVGRKVFEWVVTPVPRLSALATQGAHLATEQKFDGSFTLRLVAGCLVFAAALLAVTAWRFERREF